MNEKIAVQVAIVGGSLAGCAAARLLAEQGISVALVEKHSDPNAYKRLCGHFIQASSLPVLERLGLVDAIESAGGKRNGADIRTEWGWIRPRPRPGEAAVHGYSIRREKLDPMIRARACEAGVRYLPGVTAKGLIESGGAVRGILARDRSGEEIEISAALIVGADGRNSTIARLAGGRERRHPNHRFCYMAYYAGIDLGTGGRALLWIDGPDALIAAPNDDGLTLIAQFIHKRQLADYKRDRESAFESFIERMAGGCALDGRRRAAKLVGYTDYSPIVRSPAPRPEVALVGDAAVTCDPMLAIGCGFALQSAEWLVESTAPALQGEKPLGRAVGHYRRAHGRRLAGHVRMLNAAALAKPPNPIERLIFGAAVSDPVTARHLERFLVREIPVRRFLSPRALGRAAAVRAGLA